MDPNAESTAGWKQPHPDTIDYMSPQDGVLKPGPIFFQRITAAGKDIVRFNAAHYKIHSCEVVCIFLPLLRIVLDVVFPLYILGYALANCYQQRARAACGVKNFNLLTILQMIGNDLGHQLRNFMRSIEFSSLLARVGRKMLNQIFIYKSQYIIVLLAVCGDIFN